MTVEPHSNNIERERLERARAVLVFRRTLTPESDRGRALIASAYLDAELEKLLRFAVVENVAVADALFGQSRPLSSFSSRIDLAYLLGLIDPSTRRDLDLIRKIRNEFGHDYAPISFETPKIAGRCRSLVAQGYKRAEPRKMFVRAVMGSLAAVHTGYFIRNRASERPVSAPLTLGQWGNLKEAVLKEFESVFSRYGADYDALDEAILERFWGWKDLRRPSKD